MVRPVQMNINLPPAVYVGFIFLKVNLKLCKNYLPFLLMFAFANPFFLLNFGDILRPLLPKYEGLQMDEVFPLPTFTIVYAPEHPLITKIFEKLQWKPEVKSFKDVVSINPKLEEWKDKNKGIVDKTRLAFQIENFQVLENVNSSQISADNVTKRHFHLTNLSYISFVFNFYHYELVLSRDLKSPYLTLMYVMKCALFTTYPQEKMPNITVTILPNSVVYEIQWPFVQLIFYYLILGCIILHLKTVNRMSNKTVFPRKGIYKICNYIALCSIYQSICLVIYLSTAFFVCTEVLQVKIIKTISWFSVVMIFLLNSNTIFVFGVFLSEFNVSTYNVIYFLAMILAPQLLYMFAFGQTEGTNCGFQYLSSISPFFLIGWCLAILEDIETKDRYFQQEMVTDESFNRHCFSFKMSIILQLVHASIFILCIIYRNFVADYINDKIKRFCNSKIFKKKKRKFTRNKRRRFLSAVTPPGSVDSFFQNEIVFPKSDYIITLHRVIKSFNINGCLKKILKDVSIKFRRNKITTILGPNGAGKTTLLRIISGISSINDGEIIINGKNIQIDKKEACDNISVYVEEVKIFNCLLVSEYFKLIIYINSNTNITVLNKRLQSFIEICHIDGYLNTTLGDCPASIVRIVKIICTFLSEKPVVLLDDPMEGLDYILMQSVCALFANQRSLKTIIYTSCNSSTIEYISDSVVVLINGRKVSQADVENFNINKMLYKLMCSLEPDVTDYTLTRYMKQIFPMIRFDETVSGIAYFNVPKMDINDIWHLLNSLDHYGSKLGIWRYKFVAVGMRHFLSHAYDKYLKKKKKKRIFYHKHDLVPEKIKDRFVIYRKYFVLALIQRIIFYCRYPNRLLLRFVIPILVLLLWINSTSLSHPTIFIMDDGYLFPSYKDEISNKHQIFIACKGTSNNCSNIFTKLAGYTDFIYNIYNFHYPVDGVQGFESFQTFLYEKSIFNFLDFNNFTLFAIYFSETSDHIPEATILANDYKSLIFAYNMADNIMLSPKTLFIEHLERTDLKFEVAEVEINYILRLIMILLFAYYISTYRYVAQSVQQQFRLIHHLAGVNFSVMIIPAYLIDVLLYLLIMFFMVLFLFVMGDHKVAVVKGNIVDMMLVFLLFVFADSSFKLLTQYLCNYNPLAIFLVNCLDIFIIFYASIIYMINYILKILKYSYPKLKEENIKYFKHVKLLRLLFPSANLNDAIQRILENDSGFVKGMLIVQCIFFMIILFTYQHESYRIKEFFSRFHRDKVKLAKSRIKTLTNENSFLYIKDISFVKDGKVYFENVNLELKKGSVWGIIGRNNSGKTHFLNIILGRSLSKTGGVYLYNEHMRKSNFIKKGVKIGFCSEKVFYVSDLTVEETLIYWSRLKLLPEGNLTNFVLEILNILLLLTEINTRVKDLSLTNIKKLDIAIAIIGYPEIIILDDPLSYLDTLSRQGVINLIERAKNNDSTILVTASEISELRHILTNVAIFKEDQLEYHGKFVDAILKSKLGYYLTIFLTPDMTQEYVNEYLTPLINKSFKHSSLFKIYPSHFIYFLPFQNLSEPNTTKILLFMETIRSKFNFERYLIKYDVFFSNSL